MKMKWHRVREVLPEDDWEYHLWGLKIGLHKGYFFKGKWEFEDDLEIGMFSHFFPFPNCPRKRSL